jgi:hypothetical protein
MSRRNRRRNQPQNAGQQEESGPQAARRYMNSMPLPTNVTFVPNSCVWPGDPPPPPPPADGETGQPRRESRANATRLGLRSKLLFPVQMKELIDKLAVEYSLEMKTTTSLQEWCAFEMARSTVQCDESNDQLLINKVRIIEDIGTNWDDQCDERVQRLGARLPADSCRVQRALASSKHGALYLVDKLTLLGDAVDSNGVLDNAQMTTLYDLVGIDTVYRNGCRRVPTATDPQALRAFINNEVGKHRANLAGTLNARSDSEKRMAALGIARFRDAQTRALRSDLNRARKRYSWALESLRELQRGTDAAMILDPDTGAPIAAGPPARAVPEPHRPAAPAPPPPPRQPAPEPEPEPEPDPEPVSQPSSPVPPLPAGYSDEAQELYWVAAGTVLNPSAMSVGDEPGPPPPTA